MKRLLLIWVCIGLGAKTLFAQESKYDVALSTGFYSAPNYTHITGKQFLSADFDYHLQNRWTISTGLLSGQFAYFEDWRSNAFSYDDYTNAKGYESHFSLTAAYSVIKTDKFRVQVGSGIGLFTQRLKYPYRAASGNLAPNQYGEQIFTTEESFSLVEIPIKVEAYYLLGRRVGVGARAGTFLQANRSLSIFYFGPQLRVRL
ncbi:hypothetical protein [Spirosoma utsteinense]|uniref:Outer membrane protein beta-barrel domain-containing protein n=1 Tax=Spirosoma utsteinense TaxID=2585773 RepID=A0ABR6WFK6_9BACT|nr:hypothetical protein [Spirosoma utsteinense]MBC3795333.1 hypothetical protein [Spirosoma utsteinense]